MRLIDADALTKKLRHLWNTYDYVDFNKKDVWDVWDELENAPTIDAVEVVRCIDCKWCSEDYDTDGNVPYWTCKNWDCGTDADGFCHEAERKTDG